MGRRDGEWSGGFAFLALRLAVALPSPSPLPSPCSVLIEDLYWLRFYVRINGQWDKARERRGSGVYVCLFVCVFVCVFVGVLCYLRKCCKGPETCSINGVINEAPRGAKGREGSIRKA